MAGCSLSGNDGPQGIISSHFPVENQANPFACCSGFHRNAHGASKNSATLQHAASSQAKNALQFAIIAKCSAVGDVKFLLILNQAQDFPRWVFRLFRIRAFQNQRSRAKRKEKS
jgi:hypothetical protein